MTKLEELINWFDGKGRTIIALSGGVDSALVAYAAHEKLGNSAIAVTADYKTLSQEELAVLLGSEAHIEVFFKRADKNTSGDLDLTEVSLFINELIFPSQRKRGRE